MFFFFFLNNPSIHTCIWNSHAKFMHIGFVVCPLQRILTHTHRLFYCYRLAFYKKKKEKKKTGAQMD